MYRCFNCSLPLTCWRIPLASRFSPALPQNKWLRQCSKPWYGSICSALLSSRPCCFALGKEFDAALRPVHIRNVGSLTTEPADAFWRGIYSAVGVEDILQTGPVIYRRSDSASLFQHAWFCYQPCVGAYETLGCAFSKTYP